MQTLSKGIFLFLILLTNACCHGQSADEKRPLVLIKTDFGAMKIALYNETPKHRDNFLKLAKAGYFDGVLFHRVIKEFMIQGGDPDTRNAQPGQKLGDGGPGYEIENEINPSLLHKKGALAAARQGDDINPEKKSSGSQFYIVQGVVFPSNNLQELEKEGTQRLAQSIMRQLSRENNDSLNLYRQANNKIAFDKLATALQTLAIAKAKEKPFKLSDEQRALYTTVGGTPHLDGNYTVFGEVIEGLAVLDSIAAQRTGPADRPLRDIKMEVKVVKE
ncbi:MAG: peptidylprolyl isomerase [Bacteroidia bacterium]|nr:peptidylprolyl isomerase [Bacteroidia bacterium]